MCGGVIHNIGVGLGWWGPYLSTLEELSQDKNGAPTAPVTNFNQLPDGYEREPRIPALDSFVGITYQQAYNDIASADQDVAPGIPQGWQDVSNGLKNAAQNFQTELTSLHANPEWKGATADAVYKNVTSSLPILGAISDIAQALSVLSQAFHQTMWTTQNDIASNYDNYWLALSEYPEQRNQIVQHYSTYAQSVLNDVYLPNIANIGNNLPSTTTAPTPHLGGAAGAPSLGGSSPVITGPGGSPAITGPGGSPAITGPGGSPNAFAVQDPRQVMTGRSPSGSGAQTPSPTQSSGTPATTPTSAAAMDPSSLANTASQAAQGLGSPLQSLGQLGSMAGQGAKPPPGGPGGAPSKLAPGKLADSLKPGGGVGKMGGGAGAQGPMARPAGAPAGSGGMAGSTVAAGSRAGVSAGPGAAGAGAPAAGGGGGGGQHGGAQGGVHQPNKVLRRKKNGEEIVGDAEAVVPVLGEPAHAEAAKPGATT